MSIRLNIYHDSIYKLKNEISDLIVNFSNYLLSYKDYKLGEINIVDNREKLYKLLDGKGIDYDKYCVGKYCDNCVYVVMDDLRECNIENIATFMIAIFHEIVHVSIIYLDESGCSNEFIVFLHEYLANYISYDYIIKLLTDDIVKQNYFKSIERQVMLTHLNDKASFEYKTSTKMACMDILKKHKFFPNDYEPIEYLRYYHYGLKAMCYEINSIIDNKKYLSVDEVRKLESQYYKLKDKRF
mgnify:FL=1